MSKRDKVKMLLKRAGSSDVHEVYLDRYFEALARKINADNVEINRVSPLLNASLRIVTSEQLGLLNINLEPNFKNIITSELDYEVVYGDVLFGKFVDNGLGKMTPINLFTSDIVDIEEYLERYNI